MTAYRFHVPPGWPTAPEGWAPPPGWVPDPSWPEPPYGWQFWTVEQRPTQTTPPPNTYGPSGALTPTPPNPYGASSPLPPPSGPPPVFAPRASTPQHAPIEPPAATVGSRAGSGMGCAIYVISALAIIGSFIAAYIAFQTAASDPFFDSLGVVEAVAAVAAR